MTDLRGEADRVLQATDDLRQLRTRLAELDAERAAVERKIEERLAQIGSVSPLEGDEPRSTADQVLAFLKRHPDAIYSAIDIAREWKLTSEADINNVRTALWRLHSRRTIEKISFGRYMLRSKPRAK